MNLPLVGTLVLAVFAVPYAAEVFYQVWLQARFLEAVPERVRAGFPRHPRRPILSFFASLRFQFAVLRYARRRLPEDSPAVAHWKRRMRASMVRESLILGCLAVSTVVLLALGWRPIWPAR